MAVRQRRGDLLGATEQYIAHQCNATSTGAAGLAAAVFAAHPSANIYRERPRPAAVGSIHVRAGRVVNMIAQRYPGRPRRPNDTAAQRLAAFADCLEAVGAIDGIASVAFPHRIGCGLGGGQWPDYSALIEAWAARHPAIAVAVYAIDG